MREIFQGNLISSLPVSAEFDKMDIHDREVEL